MRKRVGVEILVVGAAAITGCGGQPSSASQQSLTLSMESKVTVGSPSDSFVRNVQNEPAVAYDPSHPWLLAAGANEAIDNPPCDGSNCSQPGVGGTGVYLSLDAGRTWTQPTY